MEIRDLETLGPLVASSLRSDATAQGPRVSKSRISMDSPYNLYEWEDSGVWVGVKMGGRIGRYLEKEVG